MKNASDTAIHLRIRVIDPPDGVIFQIQAGRDTVIPPTIVSPEEIVFDFTARVGRRPDGQPTLLGPFIQGPPNGRFVYVNSGTLAGQTESPWTRRAKVPLAGITWEMIDGAFDENTALEVEIAGTGRDGGPAAASVQFRGNGWRIVPLGPSPSS